MKYGSDRFAAEVEARGMQFIAQIFSSGPPPIPDNIPGAVSACGIEHPKDNLKSDTHNVKRHCAVWAAQVREAMHLKRVLRSITSHTGRDYFTPAEADEMLSFCEALEAETGAPVYHETHRARMFYSPWVMAGYLERHPGIRLVADLSHYTCVAEANTHDPELDRVVREVIVPRVRHVHARVGFEEGPQVRAGRRGAGVCVWVTLAPPRRSRTPAAPPGAPTTRASSSGGTRSTPPRRPAATRASQRLPSLVRAPPPPSAPQWAAAGVRAPPLRASAGPRLYAWSHPYTDEPLANMWEVRGCVCR